jgi:plastocyanin
MKMQLMTLILLMVGAASSAHAAEFNINEANQQFSENSLIIKAGDTLNFINTDKGTHNILVVNAHGDADDLGLQKPGEKVVVTLSGAGEYKAHCAIHPAMNLKITVQ